MSASSIANINLTGGQCLNWVLTNVVIYLLGVCGMIEWPCDAKEKTAVTSSLSWKCVKCIKRGFI